MNKRFIGILAAVFAVGAAFAAEDPAPVAVGETVVVEETAALAPVAAPAVQNYNWTFIAFAFGTDLPKEAATTSVYGVKVGIPASGGPAPVYGVEASVLWAGSDNIYGFQGSLIAADSKNLNGLQLSLVNFGVDVAGIQIGIVNFSENSGLQFGLLNHIKNSPIPWLPLINCKF